jgi:tetratricopeptide (TPR) repeat protein
MILSRLSGLRSLWRRPRRLLAIGALLALIVVVLGVPGMYLWAEYHYRAAEEALDRCEPAEARRHLDLCLSVWPQSVPTRLLAARAARQTGDLEAAAIHLTACEKAGRTPETTLERALIQAQRGEVDPVAEYCNAQITRGHPAAPLILEALARGYLRRYRLLEASDCISRWLQMQPDSPQAYFLQGWLKESWDLPLEAAADFRKVLALDPKREDAQLRLSLVLLDRNLGAEAVGHLEELHRRHPDNLMLQVLLARSRHQMGQPAPAAQLLDGVLAVNPELYPALALRGQLALQAGQPAPAAHWLRLALNQVPGDHQSHYLLHQALVQCGQQDEARKELDLMKACQADVARIRDIIDKKMSESPRDPVLHTDVGRILLRSGSPEQGLRWLKSALEIDPGHRPAHLLLAEYYERLGNMGRAQRHRDLAGQPAAGTSPGGPL